MTAEHFCLGVFVTKYPDGDESFNALCKCTRTFGEFDTKPEARRSLLGHVARMAGIKRESAPMDLPPIHRSRLEKERADAFWEGGKRTR